MTELVIEDIEPLVRYTVGGTPDDSFDVPYAFFDEADLEVYVDDDLLTITADYTVSGTLIDTGYQGGTVTLTTPVSNAVVTILRNVEKVRNTDFPNAGAFNIKALNKDLDRIFAILQDLTNYIGRALTITVTDGQFELILPSLDDRAGKVLGFDILGEPIAVSPLWEFQGDWTTATAYNYGDSFRDPATGDIYVSISDHTSTSIAADLAADKIRLVIDFSTFQTLADEAAASAAAAQTAETNAETAETNAETAETNAEAAQAAAEAAQTAAEAAQAAAEAATLPSRQSVGSIVFFAGTTAPTEAEGWLVCDGSTKAAASYPDLYEAGLARGMWTAGATFTLPDLQGRIPIGAGTGTDENAVERTFTANTPEGEYEHDLTINEIPPHTHNYGRTQNAGSGSARFSVAVNTQNALATTSAGGGNAHENMPPVLPGFFCIRWTSAVVLAESEVDAIVAIPLGLSLWFPDVMDDNEVLLDMIVPADIRLPSGSSGIKCNAGGAATAETTITIYKNGDSIGTLVWDAAGTTPTITHSSDTDFDFSDGDRIRVVGPATADATLSQIRLTFRFTRLEVV